MKPTWDLPARYLTQIRRVIEAHLGDVEFCASGSRVYGLSHKASALELIVRANTLVGGRYCKVESRLSRQQCAASHRVLDWRGIPDSFKGEIERGHVVIYPML